MDSIKLLAFLRMIQMKGHTSLQVFSFQIIILRRQQKSGCNAYLQEVHINYCTRRLPLFAGISPLDSGNYKYKINIAYFFIEVYPLNIDLKKW